MLSGHASPRQVGVSLGVHSPYALPLSPNPHPNQVGGSHGA